MKTSIIILSILLPYASPSYSQPDMLPPGEYRLDLTGTRPSAPYPNLLNYNTDLTESGSGPEYTTEVTRHHIIPYNVLYRFYNTLILNRNAHRVAGFLNIFAANIPSYAGAAGVDCIRLGDDLIEASNLALAHRQGWIQRGSENAPPGFDTFAQFYSWIPGNLMIGPTARSDDPGESLESNAFIVIGAERFDILARLYSNMLKYIESSDSGLLNSISADLARVARTLSIAPLNANNWVYSNGKYKLREFSQNLTLTQIATDIKVKDPYCDALHPSFDKSFAIYSLLLNGSL